MRLLDLVRKYYIEWPSGAEYCVQQPSGRVMFGCGSFPSFVKELWDGRWTNPQKWGFTFRYDKLLDELADDLKTKVLTKEEFLNMNNKANTKMNDIFVFPFTNRFYGYGYNFRNDQIISYKLFAAGRILYGSNGWFTLNGQSVKKETVRTSASVIRDKEQEGHEVKTEKPRKVIFMDQYDNISVNSVTDGNIHDRIQDFIDEHVEDEPIVTVIDVESMTKKVYRLGLIEVI